MLEISSFEETDYVGNQKVARGASFTNESRPEVTTSSLPSLTRWSPSSYTEDSAFAITTVSTNCRTEDRVELPCECLVSQTSDALRPRSPRTSTDKREGNERDDDGNRQIETPESRDRIKKVRVKISRGV